MSKQATLHSRMILYLCSNYCLYFIDPGVKTGAKDQLTSKLSNTVCLKLQRDIHTATVCHAENMSESITFL